jgi:hypothetical protein
LEGIKKYLVNTHDMFDQQLKSNLTFLAGIQEVVGRCYISEEADTSHKEGLTSSQKRVDPAGIPVLEFFFQISPALPAKARSGVGKNG